LGSEVGDWKKPQFKAACSFAVCQGLLIAVGDALMLTTVGAAAG
jgi:hypothetical protein